MKRKVIIIRILSILLMAFMVFSTFSGTALATGNSATTGTISGDKTTDVNQFDDKGNGDAVASPAQNIIGAMISIIQVIGTGVAIIILIWLAIKYIMAAPNEKAEIKKTVTIYVVGAIVLFSASALLGFVKNFAENNVGT